MKRIPSIFTVSAVGVIALTLLANHVKAGAESAERQPAPEAKRNPETRPKPASDSKLDAKPDSKPDAKPEVKKEVHIDNFSFGPQTLTIAVGDTVTWTNRDDEPHKVVSTEKVFQSKTMDTQDKFSYAFTKPGTYRYFCSLHPTMTGSVVVKSVK